MRLKLIVPFCGGLLLSASAYAQQAPAYSGTWSQSNNATEMAVEQSGSSVHVKEQHEGKLVSEYTCTSDGKTCEFRDHGKKCKVELYFNGPILVEIRTRGDVITKRRFGWKENGKSLEVETIPLVPSGKAETVLYARQ